METLIDIGQRVWEKDGTRVLLRPFQFSDFELERDFVYGLSQSTGYMRLMSGRSPSIDEIHGWTNLDSRSRAVIATVLINDRSDRWVSRPIRLSVVGSTQSAPWSSPIYGKEKAFTQLLAYLIDLAIESNVRRLSGTTLSENKAMLGLGLRLGFKFWRDPRSAFLTELSIDLESRKS